MGSMHPRTAALAGTVCLAIGWALGSQSAPPASSAGGAGRFDGPRPLGVSAAPQAPLTEDLRLRLERLPEPPAPGRNPFRFGAARPMTTSRSLDAIRMDGTGAAADEPAGVGAASDPAPAAAVETVTLSGIATDETTDGPRRTAILNAGGQLVFAVLDDRIPGGFRVVSIDADSVTLIDASGGERTLRLR